MDYNGDVISEQEWDEADRQHMEEDLKNEPVCPVCGEAWYQGRVCYNCGHQ